MNALGMQLESPSKMVSVALQFDRYISQPFWREKTTVIDVAKNVHPKLGEAKKQQAINAQLEKMGITREEYDRALILSKRPFYTIRDSDPMKGDGEIIIPARSFLSFLNHASMLAPKAIPRINEKGLTFIAIRFRGEVEGLTTGKNIADAHIFSRYVKNEESNQRMLSESSYISDFTARAEVQIDTEVITPNDLLKLVQWGGKWIGIGAARPQGFGRFTVSAWDVR